MSAFSDPQMKSKSVEEASRNDGSPDLVERCLKEIIRCPKSAASRPYISAVAKLAAGLQLAGTDLATVKKLTVLAGTT